MPVPPPPPLKLFHATPSNETQAQEKAEKEDGRRPPLREVARSSAGLSEDEFAAVMQEGMEARQKLVVCNLALVVSLSNKYKRSHFNCNCLQVGAFVVVEIVFGGGRYCCQWWWM